MQFQLWACNSTLSARTATVKLISYDLDTKETDERTFDITLQANSSTEVWTGNLPLQPTRTSLSQTAKPIVVQARLHDNASDKILARYSNWPEPYKYLSFPEPSLTLDIQGDKVTLNCKKPVKGIILDAEGDEDVKWSDQAIDLFPGDPQTVMAQGLGGRQVSARYLGSDGL